MTPPKPFTPIRSDAELYTAWSDLMGEGGFSIASLWVLFLDADDRMQPTILPIEPLPAEPDDRVLHSLARVLGGLLDTGEVTSVALLLSRPGAPAMTDADRRWARALRIALDGPLARWPVHLATRDRIQVFAPDDLIAA